MYKRGKNILTLLGIGVLYQFWITTIISFIVSKSLSVNFKEALSVTFLMSNEIILNIIEYLGPVFIILVLTYFFFGPEEMFQEETEEKLKTREEAKFKSGSQFIDSNRIENRFKQVKSNLSSGDPELLTEALKRRYFESEEVEFFSKPMIYMSKPVNTNKTDFKFSQKITELDLTDEIFEK